MKVTPKKANGAMVSAIIKRLKKAGLASGQLALALEAVRKPQGRKSIERLPRKVIKRIIGILQSGRPAVVVLGRKSFKVCSLGGYQSLQRHGSRMAKANKPWQAAAEARTEVAA